MLENKGSKNTKAIKNKIMIIEDNEILGEMYMIKLKKEGFDVLLCMINTNSILTVEDILNDIKNYGPDLILLDLMMPIISGYDILEKVETEKIDSPILVFSNLTLSNDKDKSLAMGAKEYIVKSDFTPAQLVEKIKQYL